VSLARRATLVSAFLLAGCPLPQPLPDYPAGAVTPPRILVDEIAGGEAAVQFVPANCTTTEPVFTLSARVLDTNTIETIEARWFVNYDGRFLAFHSPWQSVPVPADPDPAVLTRQIPAFAFQPYQHPPAPGAPPATGPTYPDAGIVRVVELVVSNGFDPAATTTSHEKPYRTPLPGFETQVYRWVFLSVVPQPGCTPGSPGCCP
jgi:hypothetical protein